MSEENHCDQDMPAEVKLDYDKAKPNRFAGRLGDEKILVTLDPDVAAVFRDAESVNRVLRALIETMPSIPADPA